MVTNGYTWTDEDVKFVEKAIEIRNRGYFINGGELVERYNRILGKNRAKTNCSSCLRGIVTELENALRQFKKDIELQNQNNEKVEETKTVEEPKPKKTVGRKKKDVVK